ncbi:ABC transporter substrate-binding protein [Klebsiella pneumoniae]|uniref:ABC transporter substrate-binding protein n=1 Tax=Klebsiella pneumoniae TaxID=573 RepID=UPI0021531178|nr:ABC transporter substrate-binding protein [Klebsiella pneumoniae]
MTQPVSRKWWLALSIAAALASAPAFAAKDVVVAVGSNFTTLDPYDANDTLSQAVAKSFYQGLFGLDKEMKLQNVLAESYTVSPDGLVYTIKLHSGVKFQDGTDFNAEAVKANLDRASNPDNHLKRYNLYKNIASTEAVDPTTVKITLKQPFSAFINILAHPATGVVPPSIAYAQTYTAWPYDPAKARQLLKEAGYPNGFSTTLWSSHNHSTAQKVLQFTQQQLAQVGIKAQVTAMDAGQRAAEVEGKGQKESGVRMFYTGWSASTGEADWALSPLFASQNWPPTLFNTAFYSNPQVDNALSEALKTTDPQEKTKLYKEAQDIIWKESPWVPLVVEKLVSAHSKNLTGFYIQPDTGFSFEQADLTP